jgi:cytidine deaminase
MTDDLLSPMSDPSWQSLRDAAKQASSLSHSPYSSLAVGAAVRTSSGGIHVGANVENASFGLSICAERLAVFKAVTDNPEIDVDALIEAVVAVDRDGNVLSPCGACRQVILEFGPDAEICLPAGVHPVRETLAEPFEKTALGDVLTATSATAAGAGTLGDAVHRVFMLSEDDRVLLMRLLAKLRRDAADMYGGILPEKTRSVLFVREGQYLIIPPGFFSNFENPEERTIRILLKHGITGNAYASKEPNFGVPCSDGALHADPLPLPEQAKVDSKLKWVAAWPLAEMGAVSVDGFDEIEMHEMRGIANSDDLKKIVDRIDLVLNE